MTVLSTLTTRERKLLCDHVWSLIHSTDDVEKNKKHLWVEWTKACFITDEPNCQTPPLLVSGWCLHTPPSPPCPWKQTSLIPRLKSMHGCVSCTFSQQSKSVKLNGFVVISSMLGSRDMGGCNNSLSVFWFMRKSENFFVNVTKQKASMQMHPLCMWNVFALSALMLTRQTHRQQLERCWWSQLIKCSMKVHLQDRISC